MFLEGPSSRWLGLRRIHKLPERWRYCLRCLAGSCSRSMDVLIFCIGCLPARQWVTDSDQKSSRLPPLGPPMLASLPTIVLITQNLRVQLCCVRSSVQEPKITTMSCSLEKRDEARDLSPVTSNMDILPGLESHCCTHATIGLAYNGPHAIFSFELKVEIPGHRKCDLSSDPLPGEGHSP